MITQCDVYVIGQGFIPVQDVSPGDKVYTLKGMTPEIARVESVGSEFISKTIHRIHTGIQQVEATEDTRYLYVSEAYGPKYISFRQIDQMTPNKEAIPTKYLPVLGAPFFQGNRSFSDQYLEQLARMMTLRKDATGMLREVADGATGEDAFVFIDLIEHWASDHPGLGRFGKLNRKSRAFYFYDNDWVDEFRRLAMLAGWCTLAESFDHGTAVQVAYDGVFVPGDVPKTQKYGKKLYRGNVFRIDAKNRPIYGRFGSRAYYLPFTSSLNEP